MGNDYTIAFVSSYLIGMENPITELSDGEAIAGWTRGLAAGDDDAWRWFHHRYYVTLLRYAAHRSGDVSAASDIVQQAYLRIARHARPFVSERDFSNWLFCLVRCAASDHTRHRSRRSLLAERYAHWCDSSDDGWEMSAHHTAALTREALDKLPLADADLLRRKYCEGDTTEKLAIELGTTSKTIEHRLARLRGQLREILIRIQ